MVATELFVIACLFAMIVGAALYACARAARAFRLAPLLRTLPVVAGEGRAKTSTSPGSENGVPREIAATERSRAAAVASVLVAMNRRERGDAALLVAGAPVPSGRTPHVSPSNDPTHTRVPVGRSFTRRTHARVSAGATRRDQSA